MVSNVFLTPAEVGEILKVTPQTVRAMCERGELDHVRFGTGKRTTYRIRPRFLEKLTRRIDEKSTAEVAHDQDDPGIEKVDDDEYIKNWLKK